jgi:hypothetical protein
MRREKLIGNRKGLDDGILPPSKIVSEADQWLKTVDKLRCTKKVCKKGIYKFKTFEEADQWMEVMILQSSQGSQQ